MVKITKDANVQEAFERFSAEIRNKTLAEAFLAVKDCINQKEFCKRVNINESRFSRVLTKLEKEKANGKVFKTSGAVTAL